MSANRIWKEGRNRIQGVRNEGSCLHIRVMGYAKIDVHVGTVLMWKTWPANQLGKNRGASSRNNESIKIPVENTGSKISDLM